MSRDRELGKQEAISASSRTTDGWSSMRIRKAPLYKAMQHTTNYILQYEVESSTLPLGMLY